MATLMPTPSVTRIAPGTYQVEHDGLCHIVYVTGTAADGWAFADGRVYRADRSKTGPAFAIARAPADKKAGHYRSEVSLAAPMPATVLQVLTRPGASVKKGDTLILLEAMKMELPLRAPADATVVAVHCREGELVQPDVTLIEFS
jgi:biotin carboxyl carrier protein